MDFNQIDKMLNKYFEGLSSLEEERQLKKYFASTEIAEEHRPYKALFNYFEQAQNVTNPIPVRFNDNRRNYKKYYAAAAALIIGLGLFGLLKNPFHKPIDQLSTGHIQVSNDNPEKKKEAVKEIKKFAEKVNDGIQKTGAISIFGQTTKKVFNLKKEKK